MDIDQINKTVYDLGYKMGQVWVSFWDLLYYTDLMHFLIGAIGFLIVYLIVLVIAHGLIWTWGMIF